MFDIGVNALKHYTTEREQFSAHAQERIARKGATTSPPERERSRRFYPSSYKYIKDFVESQNPSRLIGQLSTGTVLGYWHDPKELNLVQRVWNPLCFRNTWTA